MLSTFLLTAVGLSSFTATAAPTNERTQNQTPGLFELVGQRAKAFAPRSNADFTPASLPIVRRPGAQTKSSAYLRKVRQARKRRHRGSTTEDAPPPSTTDGPLQSVAYGAEYLASIQFGDQTVNVVVDSGSSDTWLISSSFECVNQRGTKQAQSKCNFGGSYSGQLLSQIPDVNFNIGYADGEEVLGIFGYQDVTVGGVTVTNQTVALGTKAYWNGDGVSSGLMGLAYPTLTSMYKGTNPKQDSSKTQEKYNPIFTTMYTTGLIQDASYSLALMRGSGGYIAFGGIPADISGDEVGDFAVTPIIQQTSPAGGGAENYYFYSITPDALAYPGASDSQTQTYIVDSGTSLMYVPTADAAAVAALFDPPATSSQGLYTVQCNATTAPQDVGVTIGGTTFTINPADLILTDGTTCISGIQDGGSQGPFILGDVFLTNVVAVFDVGAAEMQFASHSY